MQDDGNRNAKQGFYLKKKKKIGPTLAHCNGSVESYWTAKEAPLSKNF